MDIETKDGVIFQMQDRLDKLEHDYENLIEQIRLANQQRFGRHTEKLGDNQYSQRGGGFDVYILPMKRMVS